MNINSNNTSFKAKFLNTQSFKDVVNYAEKQGKLTELDTALNRLKNANEGDILIIHGKTGQNVYSNFTLGKRSIINKSANSPAEASYNAIIELGKLDRKFRKLICDDIKSTLKACDIIEKYSV